MSKNEDDGYTIKIDWGIDMDKGYAVKYRSDFPSELTAHVKGRCQSCWGGFLARSIDEHRWTGIKCRICGRMMEGAQAAEEHERLDKELALNLMHMSFGRPPEYGKGMFVMKVLPTLERLSENELHERIKNNSDPSTNKRWLNRSQFPRGSPALFQLQATALLEGVNKIHLKKEKIEEDFLNFSFKDDGTAVWDQSAIEGFRDDPDHHNRETMRRMGSTMNAAMMAAFACELVMKAISLTCQDRALRSHDLIELYSDLPEFCKERTRTDFPTIEDVLEKGRNVFGKWRYFEQNVAPDHLSLMIDVELARGLGKAARVFLDEANIVGLAGSFELSSERKGRMQGDKILYKDNFKLKVKSGERPPRYES